MAKYREFRAVYGDNQKICRVMAEDKNDARRQLENQLKRNLSRRWYYNRWALDGYQIIEVTKRTDEEKLELASKAANHLIAALDALEEAGLNGYETRSIKDILGWTDPDPNSGLEGIIEYYKAGIEQNRRDGVIR